MKKPYFVYGTLMNPGVFESVSGVKPEYISATLTNFIRTGLNILPSEGDTVDGFIVYCDDKVIANLDNYEGVSRNFYTTISVEVVTDDGEMVLCNAYQLTE